MGLTRWIRVFARRGCRVIMLTGVVKVFIKGFQAVAARSPEEGARLVVGSAAAGKERHGKYMRCGEFREYNTIALDKKRGDEVWDALCKRLEEFQPGGNEMFGVGELDMSVQGFRGKRVWAGTTGQMALFDHAACRLRIVQHNVNSLTTIKSCSPLSCIACRRCLNGIQW